MASFLLNLQWLIDIIYVVTKNGNFVWLLRSHNMAYHTHKAGCTPSTMLSLGEFKLNWENKLRYLGIYFINNPNRLFDVQEQITKFCESIHSILKYCGLNYRDLYCWNF